MVEKVFYLLVFVIGALTIACLFVTVPPSRKALRSGQPITAPLLNDRRLHALYILLGLQAAVMLAQLILGLVAGWPVGRTFLLVLVVDFRAFGFYAIPILSLCTIHQTRKAKKQMEENGGEPLPAMTREEASKTPRMRSWIGMCIIFAVLGVIIGVIAMRLPDDRVRAAFVLIALGVLFLLAAIAVLVQRRIYHRKKDE